MIKKFLERAKNDNLLRGSIILLFSIGLFNLLGYITHSIIARILSPSDYGTFAAIMSIIFIYGIPAEAIQTWMARITSRITNNNNNKITGIISYAIKKNIKIAIAIFFSLSIISTLFLAKILNLPPTLVIITNVMIIPLFLIPITRGVMQGKKNFEALGKNTILEAVTKIVLSVGLVILGWGIYGAITGIIMSLVVTFYLTIKPVKRIIGGKINFLTNNNDKSYNEYNTTTKENISVWVIMAAVLIFFGLDILIAKSLFTPDVAGHYAVISIIGKIIFFATNAVSKAMFPISSQRYSQKRTDLGLIKKSGLFTVIICIIGILGVIAFPEKIIMILFGTNYTAYSTILLPITISFSILSLTNLLLLHAISFDIKSKALYLLLLFPVIEIVLLPIFSQTINGFVNVLMIINIAFFITTLIIWTIKVAKKLKTDRN